MAISVPSTVVPSWYSCQLQLRRQGVRLTVVMRMAMNGNRTDGQCQKTVDGQESVGSTREAESPFSHRPINRERVNRGPHFQIVADKNRTSPQQCEIQRGALAVHGYKKE